MQDIFIQITQDPVRTLEYVFASITAFGILAYCWGLFDYLNFMFASGHDHERENGRIYLMWGATILVFTFLTWECSRLIFRYWIGE